MKTMTLDEMKQIVAANGQLNGWDFSSIRQERIPAPWDYVNVVRKYLQPSDRVLDVGTGGGEIFFSLAPYCKEAVAIDQNPMMIETAERNKADGSIDNVSLLVMEGDDLRFPDGEFDVVLLKHLGVCVPEVLRVLRPGGYFITQTVGPRSSLKQLHGFGWTPESYGPDWWQTVDMLEEAFKAHGCQIIAKAEYDTPLWYKDVESLLFWIMSIPWPENVTLETHWEGINRVIETCWTERGFESNEHRGLLIVRKV